MERPATPLSDLLLKLLGAVAAGIGVLGFVTLVGGATAYVRFSNASLPAEEAVADLPRTLLLVLGAKALTYYAALSLAAVAILFVLERRALARSESGTTAQKYHKASSRLLGSGQLSEGEQRHNFVLRSIAATVGLVVGVAAHSFGMRQPWWSVVLAVVIGLVLLVGLIAVAGHSSFLAFALTAVIASGIFGATTAGLRIAADPTVRPAAVLKKGGAVVGGIFVTATSDRVLLGEVCAAAPGSGAGNAATGLILAFPRSEVTQIFLGNNTGLAAAVRRQAVLVNSLMGRPSALPRTPGGAPCTSIQAQQLSIH